MMAVPVKTTAAGESRYFSSSGYSSLTTRQLPTVAAMFLALIERLSAKAIMLESSSSYQNPVQV